MFSSTEFKRGQVRWYIPYRGKDDHNGSVQKGKRPVVIYSDDYFNSTLSTVKVVPLTEHVKASLPCRMIINIKDINNGDHVNTVLGEQAFTANKSDMGEIYSYIEDYDMEFIEILVQRYDGTRQFIKPHNKMEQLIEENKISRIKAMTQNQVKLSHSESGDKTAVWIMANQVKEQSEQKQTTITAEKVGRRKWSADQVIQFCIDYSKLGAKETSKIYNMEIGTAYATYSKFRKEV